MNDIEESDRGLLPYSVDNTAPAAYAADAYAVWIDAPWRHGPSGEIPVLLVDPERRAVVLTRRLRLPLHLPLLADGERQDILRKRLEQATGFPVRGLRMLCRMDVEDNVPGGGILALAGVCTPPAQARVGGMLLLNIDEAVYLAESGVLDDVVTISLLRYAKQQMLPMRALTILVAAPTRPLDADPVLVGVDVAATEACVQPLYDAGHLPIVADWLTGPTMLLTSPRAPDGEMLDAVGHAYRLLAACDAVLRVGPPSEADPLVAAARRLGKPVYVALDDVPGLRPKLVEDHPLLWM